MTEPLGLSTYRWNNNIKSLLLLAAFPCLLLALITTYFFLVALFTQTAQGTVDPKILAQLPLDYFENVTPIDFTVAMTRFVAPFVFGVAILWIAVGSFFNEGFIRMATHAKTVQRSEAPELYNLLENLCISRGLTMPKLFVIDTPVKNAYASGLTEKSYSITVTRGLVEALNKDELEAVLAHELTHIINHDVRLLVVTILFGGMLTFFADMAWRSLRYLPAAGGGRRERNAFPFILVLALVLSVGYLFSIVFRFALSRRREYLADAGAVALTKSPENLISALQKISGNAEMPYLSDNARAMLIENPPGFLSLFDSHPPIESRIAVLRGFARQARTEGSSIIPKTR